MLTREACDGLKTEAEAHIGAAEDGASTVLATIQYIEERLAVDDDDDDKRSTCQEQATEPVVLVALLDHMRDRSGYTRLLEAWCLELGVSGRLVDPADTAGLLVVAAGPREAVGKLLVRWRTRSVDVDSRGRPCKERMMKVLYEGGGLSTGRLFSHHGCNRRDTPTFEAVRCDSLQSFCQSCDVLEIYNLLHY